MANNVQNSVDIINRNKMIQKVSHELIGFADSLIPSPDFTRERKAIVEEIFVKIKNNENFKVSRCLYGGSFGKKTSVLSPDIDTIIFLHNKKPTQTLKPFVKMFRDIIENEADSFQIPINKDSITYSSNTVTFEFNNGLEMDLLPACSLSQNTEEQYTEILKLLKVNQDNYLAYSSSLADIQLEFMTKQNSFTHQLIRLVKYWYKNLPLEKIYGGSYLMEILCVTVYQEFKNDRGGKSPTSKDVPPPMYEAFKAVLRKLMALNILKIAFLRQNQEYSLLSPQEINQHHKDKFSSIVLSRPCYVIDPSNPYNDIVKNLTEDDFKKLKYFAALMLRRIEQLECPFSDDLKTVITLLEKVKKVSLHIDKVFAPVIMSIEDFYILSKKPVSIKPSFIVIHYDYQSYQFPESKIIPQDQSLFSRNLKAETMCKFTHRTLECLIRGKAKRLENEAQARYSFKNGLPDIENKAEVIEAVELFLNELFQELTENTWRLETDKKSHKNCDVSVYIPYYHKCKKFAVRFSMKWSSINGA